MKETTTAGQAAISQFSAAMSDDPAPIYHRVKQAIISQIDQGNWKAKQRVPSESEFVNQLGVSRMTINRALRELTSEGYLIRMQGVGTFVAENKSANSLLEVHNIAEEIMQRGHRHSCKVLELDSLKATPEQASVLGLPTGQVIFHSVIVHYENNLPVQLEDRLVNPLVIPGYLEQDFQHFTPYAYLMRIAPLTAGEHVVEAVLPDAKQCAILAVADNEPCLLIHRQTWGGQRIVTSARLLYPGSRYKLVGRFGESG